MYKKIFILLLICVIHFITKHSKESFNSNNEFDGKTFLITGSTRGIGFALANHLSNYNTQIVVTGKSSENLEEALNKLKNKSSKIYFIKSDLSSEEGVDKLYNDAVSKLKKIDYLVNNVIHKSKYKNLTDKSIVEWKQEMNVNINSILYLTQKVLKHMKKKQINGKIFNISNLSAKSRNSLIYSSGEILSKTILERMTDILAEENHTYNIAIATIRIDDGYYSDKKINVTNVKSQMLKNIYTKINTVTNLMSNDLDKLSHLLINILKLPNYKINGKIFSTNALSNNPELSNIVPSYNLMLDNKIYKKHVFSKTPNENQIYVNKQNPYDISKNINKFLKNYDYKNDHYNIKNKYNTKLDKILSKKLNIKSGQIVFFKNEQEALKKIIQLFVPKYNSIISVFPIPEQINIIANESKIELKYTVYSTSKDSIQPKYKYIKSYIGPKTKLIYLSNPNHLTGQCLKKEDFDKFLEDIPDNVLILIDETFIEFASEKKAIDINNYKNKNIIVLRSFNNFYGYENLELSYAIGPIDIIKLIDNSYLLSSPINRFNESLAIVCLNDTEHNKKIVKRIEMDKNKLYKKLKENNISFFPSDCNFVLIKPIKNKISIVKEFEANNIILENDTLYYNSYWTLPISDPKTNELMWDIII